MGEFSSKASFHVSTQLTLYDPYWFERRKAILEKEVPEENTQVYHSLDSVIKKNCKSTFQILYLPSLPFSSKEKKNPNYQKIPFSTIAIVS